MKITKGEAKVLADAATMRANEYLTEATAWRDVPTKRDKVRRAERWFKIAEALTAGDEFGDVEIR